MEGGDFIELVYKYNARAPWIVVDYFKEKLLDSLENGEILPEGQIRISRRQEDFSIFVKFSNFLDEENGVEELQSALNKISELLNSVNIAFEPPRLHKIDGEYVLEN